MKNITFAERLREARKAAKLSQEALAKKIGRTKSTISRWESGERNPKMFEMVELEKILGIPAETLLYGKDEIKETTLSEINRISAQLEEPRQKIVLETASSQLKEQKEEEKKNANVIPLKKKKVTDEELWEIVEHGVANDGSEQTDAEKQFFFNLLREHLDNDDEYED